MKLENFLIRITSCLKRDVMALWVVFLAESLFFINMFWTYWGEMNFNLSKKML